MDECLDTITDSIKYFKNIFRTNENSICLRDAESTIIESMSTVIRKFKYIEKIKEALKEKQEKLPDEITT